MSDSPRPWTAEILIGGLTLYAAVAKNLKYGTFATEVLEHARMFKTQLEVEEWILRLQVPNATPMNINNPASGPKVTVGVRRRKQTTSR